MRILLALFHPDRSISNVIAQYAWNIYLTDPGTGGECRAHSKPWERKMINILKKIPMAMIPLLWLIVNRLIFAKPGSLVFFIVAIFMKSKPAAKSDFQSVGMLA